jgi:sodium/potassium-transporting ATPase subunit alpha
LGGFVEDRKSAKTIAGRTVVVDAGKAMSAGKSNAGSDSEAKEKKLYNVSNTDDHLIPLPELEKRLQTNFLTGLTSAEAASRLEQHGPNILTRVKRTPKWLRFLMTMFSGFAGLLWLAAILCFLAYAIDVASVTSTDEKVPVLSTVLESLVATPRSRL